MFYTNARLHKASKPVLLPSEDGALRTLVEIQELTSATFL